MTFINSKTSFVPREAAALLGRAPTHADPRERLVRGFNTLDTRLDEAHGTLWTFMRPEHGQACFTMEQLGDIRSVQDAVREWHGNEEAAGRPGPLRYLVAASHVPGIYSMGGDLSLFARLIRQRDRALMSAYGHSAIDLIYRNSIAYELPLVTIGLVQGDALGGGLECALSYDLIVAERSSKIGLPEILFNLFPGMGAYSFLSRRIGAAAAEKMILSGRIYSAEELHEMGVVDVLAADGEGELETRAFIERGARKHNATVAVYRARRRVNPITEAELHDVIDIWVDAAMRLEEPDLRKMERLASAQRKRVAAANAAIAPREAAE